MSEYSPVLSEEERIRKSKLSFNTKSIHQRQQFCHALENLIIDVFKKNWPAVKVGVANINSEAVAAKQVKEDFDNIEPPTASKLEPPTASKLDFGTPYKRNHYRYNSVAGVRSFVQPVTMLRVQRFYIYCQLQTQDEKTNMSKIKEAKYNWARESSLNREIWRLKYENNLLLGFDINKDFQMFSIMDNDYIANGLAGEEEPTNETVQQQWRKSPPKLKFISTEISGFVHVYGITGYHCWNYYLGKRFNQIKSSLVIFTNGSMTGTCYGEVVKRIKQEWIQMDSGMKQQIEVEYRDLLSQGKDMYEGKIVSIEFKNEAINNWKRYQVIHVRGDNPFFELSSSTNKFSIEPPKRLRFVRNQTVGNIVIIGKVDNLHAWNYFLCKHLKENARTSLYFQLREQWAKMNSDEQEQYRLEYEELLYSGRDIYRGKILLLEEKQALAEKEGRLKKTGGGGLITEIWGQVIENGSGARTNVAPLPIIIDYKSQKPVLLDELSEKHVYNYFLARRLDEVKKGGDRGGGSGGGVLQRELFLKLELEWVKKTQLEKNQLRCDYEKLLKSGYDYLYGKIVPLSEKISQAHSLKLAKNLSGVGSKAAFSSKAREILESNQNLESENQAWEYFKYAKVEYENEKDLNKLEKEWQAMSDEEKKEIGEMYQVLKSTGKKIVDKVMVDKYTIDTIEQH
ncbi:hypothetical protein KGF56_004126 [Candida oxycetoniae]|uniref:Uncharacterized protein n=1 Tax=Candida oxycetoniae TaxID=497107 RepID=A0AAI9WWD9_9ASCO|nr:uncharacterized protein KGF56_004126 [Candida oxycetoniae]KAI3403066.2 hypothetical protein KGF56_004126 [Candida oxycetoniae]